MCGVSGIKYGVARLNSRECSLNINVDYIYKMDILDSVILREFLSESYILLVHHVKILKYPHFSKMLL